jgi:thioredoxin 1
MRVKSTLFAAILLVCALAQAGCAQNPKPKVDSSQQIADRITASKIPVVVDFWAAWCGPCRYLDPIIEELEKEYKGKALFIKVDVDVHQALAAYFSISAIPTVCVIEDKTLRSTLRGVDRKQSYVNAIEAAIKLSKDRSPTPPAEKK